MADQRLNPIRRIQIVAVSVIGAIAVLSYVVAQWFTDGSASNTWMTVASIAGIGCAVIGVSFAVVGNTGSRR